jgi:deoxyribonuclease V
MIAAVDVCYGETDAVAACVVFNAFTDPRSSGAFTCYLKEIEPYEPGAFYKRELPCILSVLKLAPAPVTTVVIDGYVWLSADLKPGLGARLYEALDQQVSVVGVAKTAFAGSSFAQPVIRGKSAKPLFITTAGIDARLAAQRVQQMAGEFRVPALLKEVDALCRSAYAAV